MHEQLPGYMVAMVDAINRYFGYRKQHGAESFIEGWENAFTGKPDNPYTSLGRKKLWKAGYEAALRWQSERQKS